MTESNQTSTQQIADGYYTLVYTNGEHRTIRVKTPTNGNFAGKTIVGFMSGTDNTKHYTNFAFLGTGNTLNIWRNFLNANSPERIERIRKAVARVADRTDECGKAYALNSGNCFRCNRLLTNPESIVTGLGPDCGNRR